MSYFDTDGDGYADAVDLNGDGMVDAVDLNGDGMVDAVDVNADGWADVVDSNGDGYFEPLMAAPGGFDRGGFDGGGGFDPSASMGPGGAFDAGGGTGIDINGDDPLKVELADITLEGANTSFQVHYRVTPEEFADTFNAVQMVTPLVLALGANSPALFGHRLWHETRVPLFKQSIDTRHVDRYSSREPARVNFGQGWVRRGACELFREVVRIYPPLLPVCSSVSPADDLAAGRTPSLAELRLHQGTVWLWNRPIYDDTDGGHLRIEMRALPAGPSALDMVANAALFVGLAQGLRPHINELLPGLPFSRAEYNFYRAAQHGLDAKLLWPDSNRSDYRERAVTEILAELLPVARAGLGAIGVSAAECERYLGVIEQRLERRQTGALWQHRRLAQLRGEMPLAEALHEMLENYMEYSMRNLAVAEWPL